MADFLLELLSEEIPARMQEKAAADLARLFAAEIAKAGLVATGLESHATPRRLALIARGLPLATEAVSEEVKGPRADAPAQALAGFLGKTGLTREQLVERPDAKGNMILFAVTSRPGRATAEVLAAAVPAIVRAFPWPKSMRWGTASASTASLRWVRPLQGIVALLGDDLVPFEIDGISSGTATLGHRFHHPGPITIGNADDYAFKLRAAHVILDAAERRAIIAGGAAKAAAAAGLTVVPDEGLVAENAGLTEWPVPLLGTFDPAFLAVPREVIQLTMRTNQKYFALTDAGGALAPAFICTANIEANDGGAGIVAGNRKVLAARLSDAKFFWEQDLKVPLAEWAGKLDRIVFHEKLGTVADKVARVAKLARWLVEEGIVGATTPPYVERSRDTPSSAAEKPRVPSSPDAAGPSTSLGEGDDRATLAQMAEDAARLCKADLVTGMVGEFPELQGVMGGYYARAEGLPDAVADAIRDHYTPVGQGDEVPTAPVTVAVSLADKLDTLAAFFTAREFPSGSRDPYALRRAALGILLSIQQNGLRIRLASLIRRAAALVIDSVMSRTALNDTNYALYLQKILEVQPDRNLPEAEFNRRMSIMAEALGEFTVVMKPETDRVFEFLQTGGERIREAPPKALDFFADRLKVQQREAGVRHDLIDAVFALGGEDDLVRLLARVHALQAFVATEDGANLLAGYKRAANILRKEGWTGTPAILSGPAEQGIAQTGEEDPLSQVEDADVAATIAALDAAADAPAYTPEPAEAALIAALDRAGPDAAAAVERENFAGAMAALATLRGPIDAFFTAVIVNDPDQDKRASRLALLDRIRAAMHNVADFSRIEG
ncbi:glycine--tRNA ligase subunit beta [Sphingomonas solaris]|uniref:Glycine--tRNA ligase beta subunit n=1 Tax=Alterirhizorhabdus solaris TaxID=2529389 RepID=A0A558R6Z8_9SPHN|nr:glycine--tRNA ligase subunit beta [Sphingomonas solaris]TVV75159.1 glycine--tRNA ligase subunit beta [Sphingomonas solaris]